MTNSIFSTLPVLLVDDEPETLNTWELLLDANGITKLLLCSDSQKVMKMIMTQEIGAVVLDIRMPVLSGDELLDMIIREYPDIPVIISTGINQVEMAVKCMRTGAFDYLVKPVEENRMVSIVKRALEIRILRWENERLSERLLSTKLEHPDAFADIITNSPKMHIVFRYLEATAKSSKPITLLGETGTGKELLAKAAHTLSGRPGKFIPVNVAGLDDTIFSDTLFGHVRGAFTGAEKARGGQIEKASEGTLFLDEIGDLSPGSQVKLLRLLQEREYFPLGSDMPKLTTARIVVATNRNLEKLVAKGEFRKDLYYRLRSHPVQIPPLRERLEDLPLLLNHCLELASSNLGKKKPTPPKELLTLLSTYNFPGNIRELEAMVTDALSHHTSRILSMKVFEEVIALGRQSDQDMSSVSLSTVSQFSFAAWERIPTLEEATEMLVEEALRRTDSNQSIAAKLLGITQPTLSQRLKRRQV